MHRYREYGVVSQEDETLRRAFRDGFKRAGGSFSRFLEALAWHRDQARPGATEAQLLEAFAAYAADHGWSAQERDGAIDTYREIRANGPAAVTQAPNRDADRATIARADNLLRRDPARYWGDGALQDEIFEARERLAAAAEAPDGAARAPIADADHQRISEVEALLRDPSGAGQRRYWNDAALREDYAGALARRRGEAAFGRDDAVRATADAPPAGVPAPNAGTAGEA